MGHPPDSQTRAPSAAARGEVVPGSIGHPPDSQAARSSRVTGSSTVALSLAELRAARSHSVVAVALSLAELRAARDVPPFGWWADAPPAAPLRESRRYNGATGIRRLAFVGSRGPPAHRILPAGGTDTNGVSFSLPSFSCAPFSLPVRAGSDTPTLPYFP